MTAPTRRRPRRDQQRAATRQRIYEAALTAFRRDGVDRADVDEIARKAGVARATFYNHFPTKDHVLAAWVQITEARVITEAVKLEATGLGDVLHRVAELLAEEWERAPELLPGVALVIVRAGCSTSGARGIPGAWALVGHFRAAGERGEVDGRLAPHALSALFLANLLAVAVAVQGYTPRGELRGSLAAAVRVFLDGVRAR